MKHAIMAMIAALAIGSAAAARAEMPDYDVEAHCKKVSATVGDSREVELGCLQREQAAYDALKPKWDGLPATMQSYCDRVSRTVGPSFELLGGCVEQETNAAKANQQFKFKR